MTSTLETIGLIATILAISGVVLNNYRRVECFGVWLVSNALTLGIHVSVGVWSLALRDVVFLGLAVHGWRMWRKRG